jgi:D-arabinose 1-dehydrogenase-like Zn-dependent alcohol dehydrogenase
MWLSKADSSQAAPLTCAGTTIYGSIKTANLKPGQIVGISGLGALGHLGVQLAKAMVSAQQWDCYFAEGRIRLMTM